MERSQSITIRLTEEEIQKLTLLAAQRKTTRTKVIRSALKPLFDEVFEAETTPVCLNDAASEALADYWEHGPDEETREKRRYFLEKHRGWQ